MIGDLAMLLVACLLHLAAALPLDGDRYLLDIDNGTLKSVRFADDADDTSKLDLSHLDIRTLDKNTFDNVLGVESLVLSDNLLVSLPDFAFSNLTGLRNLSLANNQISSVRNLFIGLENLERLNISGNPIRHVYRGDLFGLTKSARIFTDANILWSISTGAFANSLLKQDDQPRSANREQVEEQVAANDREIDEWKTYAKLCLTNGTVTSLQESSREESDECAPVNISIRRVDLQGRAIDAFQAGWYQLQAGRDVQTLDLSDNRITAITSEMLDDLPAKLIYVNLARNAIRRIHSRMITKMQPLQLSLDDNPIELIDDDAFAGTMLTELYLSNCSQLDNLHFVASLPDTLSVLVMMRNRVSDIPDGAFAKLSKLLYLDLTGNRIESLRDDAFRGLTSLDTLELSGNGLATIQPAALRGLTALRVLNLRDNSIRDLQNVMFAGLTDLRDLDLSDNKIVRPTFPDLPDSLVDLNLMRNEIETLQRGDFVRAPARTLLLDKNNISRISRGAFDLPTLKNLHLTNNSLTAIDGDSFEGLGQLQNLLLVDNRISEITKGACKNLASLYVLDVSRNPFRRLDNGALHGLNTDFGSSVYVYENQLEEIQAGVFDDV